MKTKGSWGRATGRHAVGFLANLEEIRKEFEATDRNRRDLSLEDGFARALKIMISTCRRGGKLLFIGNGGSAAIASHQAVDYWKNGGLEAVAFNDATLLTCIGNDCGYENVFAKPLERFAKKSDVLVAISSSGRSPNILNGVKAARAAGCRVVTFSGFESANPLRRMGDVNFFVPVRAYGLVEVSHLTLLHSMLREIIHLNPAVKKGGY